MRRVISTVIVIALACSALLMAGPVRAITTDEAVALSAVPGTITVDELTEGFNLKGYGWRDDDFGYEGHHYWVPA